MAQESKPVIRNRSLTIRIVNAVFNELGSRGGFDHWWDCVDPADQKDIENAVYDAVKEALGDV